MLFPWMVYRNNPITAGNIRLGWVLASRIARVRLDGPARREAMSLDPQGKAIEGALDSLGFEGINRVRQGKTFDVALDASSKKEAEEALNAMCEKLLANTVIESFRFSLVPTE